MAEIVTTLAHIVGWLIVLVGSLVAASAVLLYLAERIIRDLKLWGALKSFLIHHHNERRRAGNA